jgi:hypothetical protein
MFFQFLNGCTHRKSKRLVGIPEQTSRLARQPEQAVPQTAKNNRKGAGHPKIQSPTARIDVQI